MEQFVEEDIIPETVIRDRFLVHRKIGEGGFGNVFLVSDLETKELCALKMLRPELAANKSLQEKFQDEAMIWMQFGKHPNIVGVRSIDLYNGRLFIALEFVPPNESGVNSLNQVIAQTKVSYLQTVIWAIQLCRGMIYAQAHGLIAHRDLKPGNLMIDPNQMLKITDFGLAIFSATESGSVLFNDPSGTPAYMPPEQFEFGSTVDMRSDIYSFGIILFNLATNGRLPFEISAERDLDVFNYFYLLHRTYKVPRIDSPLNAIITRCLEKIPDGRYQSFEDISSDLEDLHLEAAGKPFREISVEEMNAAEHNNFAVSFSLIGDAQSALRHIDKALDIAPYYSPAINNKAAFLAALGRVEEASQIWLGLTHDEPALARPFYNLGNLFMNNRPERAIGFYEETLRREPNYIPALVNMGICHKILGDTLNAIRAYDRAIEFDPRDSQVIYNKAFLLYECDEFELAARLFDEVIQLNPSNVSAYNYLGLCYRGLHACELALENFDRALEIQPDYLFAIRNREELLAANN